MLLTRQFVTPGFQYPWGFAYAVRAAQFFSLHLLTTTGVAITVLFLAGLAPKLLRALRFGGINGRWASLISVVLSVLVLHCFVPSGLNDRYLIAAIPAILLLAFAGGLTLITVLSRRKPTPRVADTVSLVLLTLVFATVFYIPRKQSYGFRQAAAYLEQARLYRNQVILCASEAFGEGMLITEMAARDHPRPGHVILRAGRVLASSDWNNQHYHLRFDSAQQIMAYLTAIPVGVLVLDRTPGAQPSLEHYRLLPPNDPGLPEFLGAHRHLPGRAPWLRSRCVSPHRSGSGSPSPFRNRSARNLPQHHPHYAAPSTDAPVSCLLSPVSPRNLTSP